MESFLNSGWRWLAYFLSSLPAPMFLVGVGPNLLDSGPLGMIVLFVGTVALILISVGLARGVYKAHKENTTNETV